VNLDPDQLRHGQGLREHGAHIVQVYEQCLRVNVTFAAKYFVAVDRELVEKIARFVSRLGRKLRQDRLQIRHLVRRHLEVGMQTDESRKLIHTLMVNLSEMQGEARRLAEASTLTNPTSFAILLSWRTNR